jgi:SAM-dependent methyltransferase
LNSAVGFLASALDYGARFSRLRWQRAARSPARDLPPDADAAWALAGADLWFVVREPSAIPVSASEGLPAPDPGRVLIGSAARLPGALPVHTLRELESAAVEPVREAPLDAPVLAFRVSEFPPGPDESIRELVSRLLADRSAHQWSPRLAAMRLDDPSDRERPEILEALPPAVSRLLDVGCGAAATSAALRAREPGTRVTGIERDPALAERARSRLDRVVEADAIDALEGFARAGEQFDAILLADILEHLEDPVRSLSLARAVASAGAALVLSVPNVGHLSVVRDLIAGRFDPVPSGLLDAGHLRWFTRASLSEFLEEAGWEVSSIESIPSTPPPGHSDFVRHFSGWDAVDRGSLDTYQWLAVARLREDQAPPERDR